MRLDIAIAASLAITGCSSARSQIGDDPATPADVARLAERISGLDLNLEGGGGVMFGQGQVMLVDFEQPCVLSLTWSGEDGPTPVDAPVAEGKPASDTPLDAGAIRLDLANLSSVYSRTGADVSVVEVGSFRTLSFIPRPATASTLTTAFRNAAHACGSHPGESEPAVEIG